MVGRVPSCTAGNPSPTLYIFSILVALIFIAISKSPAFLPVLNAMDKRAGSTLIACRGKKQRLESGGRKVGMIFHFNLKEFYEFNIYLVDVDCVVADYHQQIDPAVRVQVPYNNAFCYYSAVCFLNSTLYIFEGFRPPASTRYGDTPSFSERPKSAYKCRVNLNLDNLGAATRIPHMLHAKGIPVALPTPDGEKIIVFSTKFTFEEMRYAFELFNLDSGTWQLLPGLPCLCADPNGCHCVGGDDTLYTVLSFSFMGNSLFLLRVSFGTFGLDLNKLVWITLYIPRRGVDLNGYFETVMGRYALAPIMCEYIEIDEFINYNPHFVVHDFGDGGLFIPKLEDEDDESFMRKASQLSILAPPYPEKGCRTVFAISILRLREEENGVVCKTCAVQVEAEEPPWGKKGEEDPRSKARILIDVCCTHLTTLQTIITKRVSLGTYFSESSPYDVTFFTL